MTIRRFFSGLTLAATLAVAGYVNANAETRKIDIHADQVNANVNRTTLHRNSPMMGADVAPKVVNTGNCAYMISVDRAVNSPRNEIVFTAQDLGCGSQGPVQVTIEEKFDPLNGNANSAQYDVLFCDCGGAIAGIMPRGFAQYETKELLRKKIPPTKFGRFDFFVSIGDVATGRTLQQTILTVFSGSTPLVNNSPIVLSSLTNEFQVVTVEGKRFTYVKVVGKFPVNQPMYYFFGSMGEYGEYGDTAVITSTDGTTAFVPYPTHQDPVLHEGRVWLMTGDRSFSTVSPSFLF